jgi:hypothetical protein
MSDLEQRRSAAKQQFVEAWKALVFVDVGQHDRSQRGITLLEAFQQAWSDTKEHLDDDERRELAPVMDAVHDYQWWSATGEHAPPRD